MLDILAEGGIIAQGGDDQGDDNQGAGVIEIENKFDE